MLTMDSEGRVYRDGREVQELAHWEQDELIKRLYPNDPTIRTLREEARKATSHTGLHFDNLDWIAERPCEPEEENCALAGKLYELGGERLLTLYCNKFNFQSAALDLGMTYGGIVKWWQRKRDQLLADGLTPLDLGLSVMSTSSVQGPAT